MKNLKSIFAFVFCFAFISAAQAVPIPSGQDVGSTISRSDQEKKKIEINKTLKEEKQAPVVEGVQETKSIAPSDGTGVLIQHIDVQETTLLSRKEIESVVAPYEGKELNLNKFQEVANKVTD